MRNSDENEEFFHASGDSLYKYDFKGQRQYLCLFKTQSIAWRCVSGLMGFFFFAAAYVQHNDPDPCVWVPVYAIPCIVSWAVAFGITSKNNCCRQESPPTTKNSSSSTLATRCKNEIHRTPQSKSKSQNFTLNTKTSCNFEKCRNSHRKMNLLINIHIAFCFALGLWMLAMNLLGIRINSDGTTFEEVETTTILNYKLQMHASTEEAKELVGLCLIIAWLSLLRQGNYARMEKTGLFIGISLAVLPVVAWICVELFEEEKFRCN